MAKIGPAQFTTLGSTGPSMGAALGRGISQGINEELDLLARKKLSDLQIAQGIKQNKAMSNDFSGSLMKSGLYDQDQADFLASLSVQNPQAFQAAMADPISFKQAFDYIKGQQAPMQAPQQMPQGQAPEMETAPNQIKSQLQQALEQPQKVQMQMDPATARLMQLQGQQTPQGTGFADYMQQPLPQLGALQQAGLTPEMLAGTTPTKVPQAAQQAQPQMAPSERQAAAQQMMAPAFAGKPSTAHQQEMEAIAKRKEQWQRQEPIRKFVETEESHYAKELEAGEKANTMLDTMERIKAKWPNFILGNMSESARNTFIRDEDVRTLMAQANELMLLKAQTRRGLPSNFKIKLEGLAKADVSQPYNTAFRLLDDTVKGVQKEGKRMQYLLKMKKEDGSFPEDTVSRLLEYDLKSGGKLGLRSVLGGHEASQNTGKTVTNPKTGEVLRSDGTYWQPVKE